MFTKDEKIFLDLTDSRRAFDSQTKAQVAHIKASEI
jgi:hypothetical protein